MKSEKPLRKLAQFKAFQLSYSERIATGAHPEVVNGYTGSAVIEVNGGKVPITAVISEDLSKGESNWRIRIENDTVRDIYDFTLREKNTVKK